METPLTNADAFTCALAARHRVVLLGGMAIISYGLSRKTKDVDIWLDPLPSSKIWAAELNACLDSFSDVYRWSLAEQRVISAEEVACFESAVLTAILMCFAAPTSSESNLSTRSGIAAPWN